MKSHLSLIFILSLIVLSNSCNSNHSQPSIEQPIEHLRFKGHEITGPVTSFVDTLVADGYKINKKHNNEESKLLEGEFAGKKDALLLISATPSTHIIYEVGVIMRQKNWQSSLIQYNDLKSALTEKYGEPYEVEEEEIKGGLEDVMLSMGAAKHLTTYLFDNGCITLSITCSSSQFIVNVLYIDSEGGELCRQEQNNLLAPEL